MYQNSVKHYDLAGSPLGPMFVGEGGLACTVGKGPNIVGLVPKGITFNMRFRGQQHFYKTCLASYDRLNNEQDKLLADLHTAEFEALLISHPVIQDILREPVSVNNLGNVYLNVDFEGLAQHYGIPTRVMDFSNDLLTSAFFAVTCYDGKKDCYTPYVPSVDADFDSLYGVLYYFDAIRFNNEDLSCRPLGMHYFNRPGAQSGFAFDPKDERDINKIPFIKKIFFRHDAEASNLIFTILAEGKMLFPDDSLCGKAQKIRMIKDVCSKAACELWNNKCMKFETLNSAVAYLEKRGISVQDEPMVHFEKCELDKDCKEWNLNGKNRFLQYITIMPFFRI